MLGMDTSLTPLASNLASTSRPVPVELHKSLEAKVQRVANRHPWLQHLEQAVQAIVTANLTHRQRYLRLRALADRIQAAVEPEAACHRGCSACCTIQVEMSGWEARLLTQELGLTLLVPDKPHDAAGKASQLLGAACGFLKDGQCSIYASRPLACRLHHSLGPNAAMCQSDVPLENSIVPRLNLRIYWLGYAMCSAGTAVGDIADFLAQARRSTRPSTPKT